MRAPTTLGELLATRAESRPDHLFVACRSATGDGARLTYAAAWDLACRWAALLAERGVGAGDRVVLALPNGIDFVGAFFAAQILGAAPAATPPPADASDLSAWAEAAARMRRLAARAIAVAADAPPELAARAVSRADLLAAADDRCPVPAAAATAILQFSSGTVGPARVVQLSHHAVLAQLAALAEVLALDPDTDSAVSWLPLYHDMGLIGFLLTPAWIGRHVTLLDSRAFAARPALWVTALSDTGATITGGPPAAYALCARRVRDAEAAGFDLSRLRVALVGAEQVTRPSLELFVHRFAVAGLRESALVPTYGLAENGLAVTMPPLGRGPRFDAVDAAALATTGHALPGDGAATQLVAAVGRALPGLALTVVDDRGRELPDRVVGEIAVSGPTVMDGYLDDPAATAAALSRGRLLTGDLGYLVADELYVTGRRKELIIVAGRNYAPEAYEAVAATVPGVRGGRAVAFSVADPALATERVVIAAETALSEPAARAELGRELQRAVAGAGLPVDEVVLLPPRAIRTTASGKLRRVEWRERYLRGELTA